MKKLATLVLGLALAAQTAGLALAQDYDVVILNGRVMDPETQIWGTPYLFPAAKQGLL